MCCPRWLLVRATLLCHCRAVRIIAMMLQFSGFQSLVPLKPSVSMQIYKVEHTIANVHTGSQVLRAKNCAEKHTHVEMFCKNCDRAVKDWSATRSLCRYSVIVNLTRLLEVRRAWCINVCLYALYTSHAYPCSLMSVLAPLRGEEPNCLRYLYVQLGRWLVILSVWCVMFLRPSSRR